MNLITLHKSRIPIWVEALEGNTSDKTSFPRTIETFLAQIGEAKAPMLFVADSVLYTKETIRTLSEKTFWVTAGSRNSGADPILSGGDAA